jgi:hypothetical protein
MAQQPTYDLHELVDHTADGVNWKAGVVTVEKQNIQVFQWGDRVESCNLNGFATSGA